MVRRFITKLADLSRDERTEGWPFYLLLYLVLVMVYVMVLVTEPSMRRPGPVALFSGLMLVHGLLHGLSLRLTTAYGLKHHPRWVLAYVLAQGALVFAMGSMVEFQGLFMGLYLALIGQIAGTLWPDLRAIALAVSFYILLLVLNIVRIWSAQALLEILPIMGLMLVFVLVYVTLFVRQVQAREQTQKLLRELELAHGQLQEYAVQVEELTLSQERQRMARELHDTLAQGLAGLILQLEAADSHLDNDNAARAQHVVQQAMGRARTTLHEARLAIQALRSPALDRDNLIDALGHEVDQFSATTGLRTTFEVNVETLPESPAMAQDILRIVQESLTNTARHARASHVLVRLEEGDGRLQVVVQDDGVGFDPAQALEQPGCFGLAGMNERAAQLGGQLEIESGSGRGTRVVLSVGREQG
jgi:NarL family two-component system sensor histidine kinase YdfH